MKLLLAGVLFFLAIHSVGLVAPAWRERMRRRMGVGAWKGWYSLLSLIGLAAVVSGFGAAREQPLVLWVPSLALRHLAALSMWVAFVLWAAAYVPGNRLKARLRHPMVLGVGVWAASHLLVGGMAAHALLFGSFLAWSVTHYGVSLRRDRREGVSKASPGRLSASVVAVVLGTAAWAVFAFGLHGLLIGIKPLG